MIGLHAHPKTSHLTAEDLAGLREALIREKEAVKAQYHEDVQAAREVREEGGEDLEELAALDVGRELLYAMSEADLERVEEIEDALQRMDEGTYGLCQTGGERSPCPACASSPGRATAPRTRPGSKSGRAATATACGPRSLLSSDLRPQLGGRARERATSFRDTGPANAGASAARAARGSLSRFGVTLHIFL